MINFTVAICTYNGENRLPDVLNRLRSQINVEQISWEIIVIDNNSNDNTAKVVQEYISTWSEVFPIKYIFEPKQGLAFARQRAINEANGTFVGFLDDDNWPTPNWVAAAYSFGQEHPKAGAYGSKIHGDFEVTPPENFSRISPFLAIGGGKNPICYTSSDYKYSYKNVLPPGAGIVVKKQAWLESVPENLFLQGRVSGLKLPGDDIEAFLHIKNAGWEIWYNPEMQISHRIPKWRLDKDYLLGLMRGIGLSRYHTRMLGFKNWQKPMLLIYIVNDLRKLILHFFKYKRQLKTDLIALCEMQLFWNSFISPLYFLNKRFLK